MNSLTNKQIRELMTEFSPSPGFVLKLTRAEFEELVEDATDIDISERPESNGKRLKFILKEAFDEQVNALITALRAV